MMLMMDKLIEPSNILEDTDSDKELKKEINGKNKANWANRDQRRQESNLEPKQSLIRKQNMSGFMNKEEKCSAELA